MAHSYIVLGSGPIRIGQGIEFDYSCVHCATTLRALGHRAIFVNNNPETVSTDFDTGDALYFEPVTLEDVSRIAARENAEGVFVQFGGQTAINLAAGLHDAGIPIVGTSSEVIDICEDRRRFSELLDRLNVPYPPGKGVNSIEEALDVVREIGYPVLVRPSFVLGGRAMDIVASDDHLRDLYAQAEQESPGSPVLIDRYFQGVEAEVDAICDGETVIVPGIMEHIERAGVHSGDSMAVYPPHTLEAPVQAKIVEIAERIALELGVKGLINIQFVVVDQEPYVLEVNPRGSRTVPYLSKVTGLPMVKLATMAALGHRLSELGFVSGLWSLDQLHADSKAVQIDGTAGFMTSTGAISRSTSLHEPRLWAIKAPVFSFQKLALVEPSLGPEMKSTGEVLGVDRSFSGALYKALEASGISFLAKGQVIISVRNEDKQDACVIAKRLLERGYSLAATPGTAKALQDAGMDCEVLNKIQDGSPNILERLYEQSVSLMINTPEIGQTPGSDAARIRRACIEVGVACLTSIDTALAMSAALEVFENPELSECAAITDYLESPR